MWTVAGYYAVLLTTVAVAMWRGGPLERWAAYTALLASVCTTLLAPNRSEERRVGKERRSRWSPYH